MHNTLSTRATEAPQLPYNLQRCAADGSVLYERWYASLQDLACAVWPVMEPDFDDCQADAQWHALTPKGRELSLAPLVTYGKRLWLENWHERRFGPGFWREYTFRSGPVPRVRCLRGGPSLRHVRTQQARREADFWLAEEGEIPVRAKRAAKALPDSWDDFAKPTDRSWKSQRKGRKSWDRR